MKILNIANYPIMIQCFQVLQRFALIWTWAFLLLSKGREMGNDAQDVSTFLGNYQNTTRMSKKLIPKTSNTQVTTRNPSYLQKAQVLFAPVERVVLLWIVMLYKRIPLWEGNNPHVRTRGAQFILSRTGLKSQTHKPTSMLLNGIGTSTRGKGRPGSKLNLMYSSNKHYRQHLLKISKILIMNFGTLEDLGISFLMPTSQISQIS